MKKNTYIKIAGVLMPAALLLAAAAPAGAATLSVRAVSSTNSDGSVNLAEGTKLNASTSTDASVDSDGMSFLRNFGVKVDASLQGASLATLKARADAEINKRVASLNELSVRINGMKHVDATAKANLSATIASEISSLNSLKATIDAATDITVLKGQMQTIAQSYRVYMVVMPQLRIIAAADRAGTIADMVVALSAKLQTRITEAQASGKDTASLSASLSDMNAKAADAKVQASASISAVATLKPDNGDTAIQQANEAAFKKARASLAAANADLRAAYKDARVIIEGVKGVGASATIESHSSAGLSGSTNDR